MQELTVNLPTLHNDQVNVFKLFRKKKIRRLAVRCGRRWGKTELGKVLAADDVIRGNPVGWFAPDYRIMAEAYNEIMTTLEPIKKSSSKTEGIMRFITGGRIDFWTLENERAGRSRMYSTVVIDEGAFTKANMLQIFEQSIEPTLLDLGGKVIVLSNTNGVSDDNFLYRICKDASDNNNGDGIGKRFGFTEYHAPSINNPYVPRRIPGEAKDVYIARRAAEFADIKAKKHPLVWQQEYLADFVDWSGVAFFGRNELLVNDQPIPYPILCDGVFATIDTAVKTGSENDGTGVIYWAVSKHVPTPYPLVILDYDIQKIEGAMLEAWLPTVFQNLEKLARMTKSRNGVLGAWIEDKASGSILLQQAQRRRWPAHPIDTVLTAVGKDERAMSVSGYTHQGLVKISDIAYNKNDVIYNDVSRNHLLTQIFGFRIGDKDAARRADDLLDCFTYGISIGIGDNAGY